jgi:hypothetical protein
MSRRADIGLGVLALVVAARALPAGATPQEEQRKKLLDQLGLEKKPAPPTSAPQSPAAPQAPTPAPAPADEPQGAPIGRAQAPAAPSFRRAIHPALVQTCRPCHVAGGPAGATRLVLSDDPAADHASVLRLVDTRNPVASLLLVKASGQMHGGGSPWPAGNPAAARALAWIAGGARLDGGHAQSPAAPAPAPAIPPPAKVVAPRREGVSQTPPAPEPPAAEPAPAAPTPATAQVAPTPVDVHPLLIEKCSTCHGPRGMAAATRLVLGNGAEADLAAARRLVDASAPEQSVIITKASGATMHAGGAVLPPGSPGYAQLLAWAHGEVSPAPAAAPAPPSGPARPVELASAPAPAPPPPAYGPHGGPGIALPYGFALGGRFSLDLERGQFTGSPWADGATNALRSYHHFLFLSRESPEDRFGVSVELLSLLFWEVHVRLPSAAPWWQLTVAGGKILVPFGADPLTHQSYGGLSGFDQKILPTIWAQEGLAAHFVAHRLELAVTDDLYVVRGYALRQGDGVINLQNDFSPDDDAKLGFGNRVGLSFGPASVWYSTYVNRLGFGRLLFMQAADVTLWRVRGVPVLGHLSFGAGVLRADVSGGDAAGFGGPGLDYYDFGSYFQVRFHPYDWLYVQYRQGLRTFNNRRGLIVDDTRLTSDDGSTHNFAVVGRYRGFTAGLFYFINLEKGPEIPNDLLRVSLTYEF